MTDADACAARVDPDRLRTELRLVSGPVADRLENAIVETEAFALARDGFLLHLPNGLSFEYRVGTGVTVERRAEVGDGGLELYLNGSVRAAVAWLNGLVPIHASAIVHNGEATCFTGASGAGKSTLVAELGARGYPMQADDLIVLELSPDAAPACLPGGGTLKLWADAIAMTGVHARHRVRPHLEKRYAEPAGGLGDRSAPLARIYRLLPSNEISIREISGTSALEQVPALLHRPQFYEPLATPARHWSLLTGLSRQVRFFDFHRPIDPARFHEGVDALEAHFRGG